MYRRDAKAAIEAMREPTDDMVWHGGTAMHDLKEDSTGVYQAFIDAALSVPSDQCGGGE